MPIFENNTKQHILDFKGVMFMRFVSTIKFAAVSAVLLVPLVNGGALAAQTNETQRQLTCHTPEDSNEVETDTQDVCDIAIKKEVKINEGAYVDANDAATAPSAFLGDTITWRITVTDMSNNGKVPRELLHITDVLPAGLEYVSSTSSNGSTYDVVDGWFVDSENDLTATLEIVATATQIGTIQNTASIDEFDYCSDGCIAAYADDNSTNNIDSAYVVVNSRPRVLGSSIDKTTTTSTPAVLGTATLADTGATLYASLFALLLSFSAIGLTALTYKTAKK